MAVMQHSTTESRDETIINLWNHGVISHHIASLTGAAHLTVKSVLRSAQRDGRAFQFAKVKVRIPKPALDLLTKEASRRGLRPEHLMMTLLQAAAEKHSYAQLIGRD